MKNNPKDRVLELLFIFPTRRFYVREISRILKLSPPSVSKAMHELEQDKLAITKRKLTFELHANLSNPDFRLQKCFFSHPMGLNPQ